VRASAGPAETSQRDCARPAAKPPDEPRNSDPSREVRASAGPAETGQWDCTKPAAKPPDEPRTSGPAREVRASAGPAETNQRDRARPAAKPPDEPRTRGPAREARARTDQSSAETSKGRVCTGEPDTWCEGGTSKCGGIRGRSIAAGRTYEEVAFSGIKGGGALRILQSKRSKHPFRGNCTARDSARTPQDKRRALRLASLRRPESHSRVIPRALRSSSPDSRDTQSLQCAFISHSWVTTASK
jgi:hypothetical protein